MTWLSCTHCPVFLSSLFSLSSECFTSKTLHPSNSFLPHMTVHLVSDWVQYCSCSMSSTLPAAITSPAAMLHQSRYFTSRKWPTLSFWSSPCSKPEAFLTFTLIINTPVVLISKLIHPWHHLLSIVSLYPHICVPGIKSWICTLVRPSSSTTANLHRKTCPHSRRLHHQTSWQRNGRLFASSSEL